MSENNLDLSKLKIKRENSPKEGEPGSRKRFSLFLYGAGALFLGLAIYFFIVNLIHSDEIVELTAVSMMSPAQAASSLTASGYVVAQRKAAIASKATGRLVYLGFKEGDKVKKGEIIARIESDDVEAALQQARADLAVSQADKVDAERSYGRAQKLIEQRLISESEFEGSKARFDRVAALIASREASVRAAVVQLENTMIRAPFDGTILSKNADIGEVVAPFAAGASSRVAVVTIADMSSLQVEADVSESNIERIEINQPCEIILDAYPDKHYRGVVDKIVPTADRAKATVMTKIRFIEKDSRVLPEMSAKVHFLKSGSLDQINIKPVLAMDRQALTKRKGEDVVFLFEDNRVREVPVKTGMNLGTMIEIVAGLSSGDKVVVRPSDKLQSGFTVKLKQ